MGEDPNRPESDEDVTLADDEWPVTEQYRVEAPSEIPVKDDNAVVIQQENPPQVEIRRFPPDVGPGLLLALLGVLLILALIPAGFWLAGREDDESDASPTTGVDTTDATTPTTPTTPTARTVPELTGLTLEEARELLDKENVRVRVRRIASDGPRGEVLGQSPEPGARIAADTVVLLTVSRTSTPERVKVPNVEGLPRDEAVSILRQAGLEPDTRTIRSSEPEGLVVSQNPSPDAEVAPQTTVVLEIAGPPPPPPAPATIEVPRLVGLRSSEARSTLRDLGLRVTQRPVESSRPKGTVVSQAPRPGARLRKGQAVTLTVSTGPALVSVPDVVGLDEQAARNELEVAGFAVKVVEEAADVVESDGVVLGQDPAGGASRPKGSVVTITIGRFESVTPSSA
jgi:beta-lactam-binding protein with PASTA domain